MKGLTNIRPRCKERATSCMKGLTEIGHRCRGGAASNMTGLTKIGPRYRRRAASFYLILFFFHYLIANNFTFKKTCSSSCILKNMRNCYI